MIDVRTRHPFARALGLGLLALLAGPACRKSGDALLVVLVTSTEPLADVRKLKVSVSPKLTDANVAKTLTATFTPDGGVALSSMKVSMGVIVPGDIGSVTVLVEAYDKDSHLLRSGTSSVTPAAGAKKEVTVVLGAGSPDGGDGDGSSEVAPGSDAGAGRGTADAAADGAAGTTGAAGTSGGGGTGAGGRAGSGAAGTGAAGARGLECNFDGQLSCDLMQPLYCANGYWTRNAAPCVQPNPCTDGVCVCKGGVCGNECVVADDPHHCGSCTRDCVYGKCKLGICQGQTIYGGEATEVAVEGNFTYWVGGYGVYKAGLDGSNATNIAQVRAIGLTVSNGDVFIGTASDENNYPNRVMKIPASGGNPVTIAQNQDGVFSLAVRGGMLYWSTAFGGSIMKATTAGTNVTTIASALTRPFHMTADANNVYFGDLAAATNMGTIKQVSVNNDNVGAPLVLAANREGPQQLVVDAGFVYWVDYAAFGAVSKVPIGGGTVTALAERQTFPEGLVLDGTNLYWGTNDNLFVKLSTGGGALATFPNQIGNPFWLVVDAKSIYAVRDGFVYRFGKF